MSSGKKSLTFGGCALAVLCVEALIALFVHDRFVRPYLGDVLAVIFVYLGLRTLFPEKPVFVSVIAFGIAAAVELVQLTDLSGIFGEGSVFSVIIGGTFDFLDIFCYLVGGAVCFFLDFRFFSKKS